MWIDHHVLMRQVKEYKVMRDYDPSKDEATLIESLDSAIQNGYEINEWPASEIASDVNQYDSYFENINHETLVKPIQDWLDKRFPSRSDDLIKDIEDYLPDEEEQFNDDRDNTRSCALCGGSLSWNGYCYSCDRPD